MLAEKCCISFTDFENYDLPDDFWRMDENESDCSVNNQKLKTLVASLYLTYASRVISSEMPRQIKPFISYKTESINYIYFKARKTQF